MSTVKFIISSSADNLSTELKKFASTATVEAEYGESVVEGSVLTLAHHGSRSTNPAPCLATNRRNDNIEVVGLSHIDLDSLGGCAAIIGCKPEMPSFWALAAYVDINGPHKLSAAEANERDARRLYAFWAWSDNHRVFPPRDGSILNVTDKVTEGIEIIGKIIAGDQELLEAGDGFKKAKELLNKNSFVEEISGVIVRVAGAFTNHLYETPEGKVCKATIALRTDFSSLTVSFADPISGASCRDIVQSVWTDKDDKGNFLAGGHDTIAGSPRGKKVGLDDLIQLRDETVKAVS